MRQLEGASLQQELLFKKIAKTGLSKDVATREIAISAGRGSMADDRSPVGVSDFLGG